MPRKAKSAHMGSVQKLIRCNKAIIVAQSGWAQFYILFYYIYIYIYYIYFFLFFFGGGGGGGAVNDFVSRAEKCFVIIIFHCKFCFSIANDSQCGVKFAAHASSDFRKEDH